MSNPLRPGDYLIADPSIIGDLSFHRSVVLITAIENRSPMGFVINKAFDFDLSDVLPEVEKSFPLYYGGPVENDQLFFVHTQKILFPDCKTITDGLYFGGRLSIALKAIADEQLTPRNSRFFLGYSGWGIGQLENEITEKNWLIQQAISPQQLFNTNVERIWRDALLAKGGAYKIWANSPENPAHN